MKRKQDKKLLTELVHSMDISLSRIKTDDCDDYFLPFGNKNHIHTDGEAWYVYWTCEENERKWTNIKKKLRFMELVNDGDYEGRFRLERMPSEKEANTLRKITKFRQSPKYSEVHLGYLKSIPNFSDK